MATNGVGFPSSIVHSAEPKITKYGYRVGTGMMPSAEWYVLHDDFDKAIATNVPTGWVGTVIDTGATVVADTTAGHGTGVLLFDSDGATEGSAVYGTKTLQLTVGKKFWMEMRVKTEVADDSDVQFGLTALTATVNPEDLWTTTATDVIAFGVLDGDATLGILVDTANGGTSVQLGTADMVSATWTTLAIGYNGLGITCYKDGKPVLTYSGAAATIPTGVALAPFFGFRNGSAATTEGHVDYVRIVSER